MTMPQNEYRNVMGGACKWNTVMSSLLTEPAIPNVAMYPNAMMRGGMHKGTAARDERIPHIHIFLCETKYAAGMPTINAMTTDRMDSFSVYAMMCAMAEGV